MLTFTAVRTGTVDTTTPDPTWDDVDTTNVPDRERTWDHATDAELRLAAAAGIAAFNADRPRAPGADSTVLDLVGRNPLDAVGKPRTAQIMRAWLDAYEAECDAAAAAVLNAPECAEPGCVNPVTDSTMQDDNPDYCRDCNAEWWAAVLP